jgi:hypothetical protein
MILLLLSFLFVTSFSNFQIKPIVLCLLLYVSFVFVYGLVIAIVGFYLIFLWFLVLSKVFFSFDSESFLLQPTADHSAV